MQREPFHPFRICMSDGSQHEVRNPNLVIVTRRTVILAILEEGQDFPEQSVYLDTLHITRVETIDPEPEVDPES